VYWLAPAEIYRGWARSVSGDAVEGVSWIEDGIEDLRTAGSVMTLLSLLALKAEALHLADRTPEALEAIKEVEVLVERIEGRWWCAELHRLRGVFLATLGADEAQIETSFCAAINTAKNTAKQQKSISLQRAHRQPTRNTVAKKRVPQEDVDSDYLFGNFLQRPGFPSGDSSAGSF
jgi:hypothetical protein